MSAEELKIRGELETDVERDLEEEIKDGIYHLAVRLHRLYQHQKERNNREFLDPGTKDQQGLAKHKTLSEVNINIKMEGGTKIEIKEIKKEARPKSTNSRSENMMAPSGKKFEWAKSLRSGPGPGVAVNKKNENSQRKLVNYGRIRDENSKLNKDGNNLRGTMGQRKGNEGVGKKVLELGWRE